jgi:hypothetical protein
MEILNMGENTNRFLQGLAVCVTFALAGGFAALIFHAASDYTTHYTAVKIYSIAWFAACVLSFYCGLLVVPRSLGIIFSFTGLVAFAILCALDAGTLSAYPYLDRIVQILPAMLFLLAWAFIAIASCRSESKKIRLSSWLWLAVFLMLLFSWGAFHFAQGKLHNQRNAHIAEAREKTLRLVELLDVYKQDNSGYPETLAEAGVSEEMAALDYRDKRIKYFGHGTDFVLTFDDPLLSSQKAFSWDTTKNGWFPEDPKDTVDNRSEHMFLGFLRQR